MPQPNNSMAAAHKSAPTIHPEGLYRWDEFADRIPFSRETWRKRILAGQAPAAKLVSRACTAWKGADILAWLNNPDSFK
ncbi:helix-turn-helix transcriptional regulator [Alcaligenes faecalis]|uniref:helix-turn-helix transcriptional regulator n=1 Tax=Alcaligenes faecalis TaxID=511 RepID=UPI003F7B9D16